MITEEALREAGIWQAGIISPEEIIFRTEIRQICEKNTCRLYGKTWACPPAVGEIEQCREKCLQYRKTMVFSAKYPLEDSFDYEGMISGHGAFKKLCDKIYFLAKEEYPQFFILSNEGCQRCKICTYPSEKCRMPDRLFPSVEGYGIDVKQLADAAGILYCNGKNTVTYFGMLFFDKIRQQR